MADQASGVDGLGAADSGTAYLDVRKPIVIGVYGLPGSGKTFLLNRLRQDLGEGSFVFFEGAQAIETLVPGGLPAFKSLGYAEQTKWRCEAIDWIKRECLDRRKVGVVVGHFMFWKEKENVGQVVWTQNDADVYTHILYLDVNAEVISQRQLQDTKRERMPASPVHLLTWKLQEKHQLQRLCREHGILFTAVSERFKLSADVITLIRDFVQHSEQHNLQRVESALDDAIVQGKGVLETALVIDADRTLSAEDTGVLYWNFSLPHLQSEPNPLKSLFSSRLGYSYLAFRQATLLYEENADRQRYQSLCGQVASAVTIHPEFLALLRKVSKEKHIFPVIVSCGLRLVWEKVLEREGLNQKVKVIAGGRVPDGFVVTAAVKAAIVRRLKDIYQLSVWAFGDSVLDLDMLKLAHRAIVVVGEEHTRSKTMDGALLKAITEEGLHAEQVLLPSHAPPRLDTAKLPQVHFADLESDTALLPRRKDTGLQVFHAGDSTPAKLLATPMRDANVAGPALREAHRRAGHYLAIELLASRIGLEEYDISHVLNRSTIGHRLSNEQRTTIMALMRAGEPMAIGVNDAFPLAMFVHAREPEDVRAHHVQGQRQIILVDAVVNTGKTLVKFIRAIRDCDADVRIFIVSGVVQAQCIAEDSHLKASLARYRNVELVALRLSETKFTGSGSNDTGNRLFNTTHLA